MIIIISYIAPVVNFTEIYTSIYKPNGNPGILPSMPNSPPALLGAGGGAVLVLFVLESVAAEAVVVGVVEVDELLEVLAAAVGYKYKTCNSTSCFLIPTYRIWCSCR